MKTRAEVERNLASAEHRWLEASEAVERAPPGRPGIGRGKVEQRRAESSAIAPKLRRDFS